MMRKLEKKGPVSSWSYLIGLKLFPERVNLERFVPWKDVRSTDTTKSKDFNYWP